jgi:hypothetical protein
MDINIRITADGALVNALSDIAGAIAAVSIANAGKDGHLPPKTVQADKPKAEAPKAPKAPKAELKGEPISPAKAKEIEALVKDTPSPDDIIDPKVIPKVRAVVSKFCTKVGKDEGHAAVKKWLADNGFGGLSKLTYKGMDAFIAFLEKATEPAEEVA